MVKRRYYLDKRSNTVDRTTDYIAYHRQETYRNDFFLPQLPSSVYKGAGGYDDDEGDEKDPEQKSPKEIKQQLLRQLATETRLHRALYGEVAIVQSDLQWFATGV